MSPELLGAKATHKQQALYDGTKADIWAAGVMLCVMLIGRFPFEGIEMSNATNLEEVSEHVSVCVWRPARFCSGCVCSHLQGPLQFSSVWWFQHILPLHTNQQLPACRIPAFAPTQFALCHNSSCSCSSSVLVCARCAVLCFAMRRCGGSRTRNAGTTTRSSLRTA